MSQGEDGRGAYVRRVTQETQRYAEDLLSENQQLRLRLAEVENEKESLSARFLDVCHAFERQCQERKQLEERVARATAEGDRFAEQYRDLEAQNANLANLYVASYQLHGTLDRAEVLSIIQQIVANLIGCEEVGVFELDEAQGCLRLIAANGIEPEVFEPLLVGRGLIGTAVGRGETWIAGDAADHALASDARLSACIPLKLGERVSGAIALFRLLPQKSGIEALDRELFDLLATHAATALYCSTLHQAAGSGERS